MFSYCYIIVVLFILFAGIYLFSNARQYLGNDIFYIYPKNGAVNEFFSSQDLEVLQNEDSRIVSELIETVTMQSELASANGAVSYTDSDYFELYYTAFLTGGPWMKEETGPVIVLHAATAYTLFGSYNIIGKTVAIDETEFTVAGVIDGDIGTDFPAAWAPLNQFQERKATALHIQMKSYNALASVFMVQAMLEGAGLTSRDYDVIDLNHYGDGMLFRCKVLFLLSGIFCIASALHMVCRLENRWLCLAGSIICLAAFFVFVYYLSLEYWTPNFGEQFFSNFVKNITNYHVLPHKNNLPYHLSMLCGYNNKLNILFLTGVFVLVPGIVWQWYQLNICLKEVKKQFALFQIEK